MKISKVTDYAALMNGIIQKVFIRKSTTYVNLCSKILCNGITLLKKSSCRPQNQLYKPYFGFSGEAKTRSDSL